jgi:hypothetical protein
MRHNFTPFTATRFNLSFKRVGDISVFIGWVGLLSTNTNCAANYCNQGYGFYMADSSASATTLRGYSLDGAGSATIKITTSAGDFSNAYFDNFTLYRNASGHIGLIVNNVVRGTPIFDNSYKLFSSISLDNVDNNLIKLDDVIVTYVPDDYVTSYISSTGVCVQGEKTLLFYIKDEEDDSLLVGDFEATFDIYNGSDYVGNYSFDLSGKNNYSICISPSDANYTTDATMQYDATGYSARPYLLEDTELTSTTQTVNLYLINESEDTIVLLYVEDEIGNPLSDVTIKVRRYYPGEGVFKTVEVTKTDTGGASFAHLVLYDVPYSFLFERDGEVLATTSSIYIDSTSKRFPILLGDDLAEGWTKVQSILKALTFSNTTKNFTFDYTDTQSIVREACLQVEETGIILSTEICYTCVNSTSAQINCYIGTDTNGNTYVATAWIRSNTNHSWYSVGVLAEDFTADLFGTDGLIMAFFLIGILGGIGMMWKPRFCIAGAMAGLIVSRTFGLWKMNLVVFVIILVVGGVLIFFMRD